MLARRRKGRQVWTNEKIFFFAHLASWRDKLCWKVVLLNIRASDYSSAKRGTENER